jgi:hypothetical protein
MELMSVYSPHDVFEHTPGTRVRRVPEMGQILIYTPHRPALHRFNRAAWLVFELADGRPFAGIVAEGHAVLGGSPDEVERKVTVTLRALEKRGILRLAAPRTGEVVDTQR